MTTSLRQTVTTPGGRDVTTTNDYKALTAQPGIARTLGSTLLNLIPLDQILPMAIAVALKVATGGTGPRSKQIKALLIDIAKGVESEFPGSVCGPSRP